MTDEQKRAEIARLSTEELARGEYNWHYLSFADDNGFLGACWVKAYGIIDACRVAQVNDCNPGGSVQCWALPQHGNPPAGSAYTLHTDKAKIDQLCAEWVAMPRKFKG